MGRGQENGIVEEKHREPGGEGEPIGAPRYSWTGWRTWVLVFGVFVVPILLYAAVAAVAASSMPSGRKVAFSAALVICAEGTFLVSALVLGREAVRRYRRYLNPRHWFGRSGRD